MSPDLSSASWFLPSPRKFIQNIGQNLRDGVSQVVFSSPTSNIFSFNRSLLGYLENELYLNAYAIDLSTNQNLAPFELLCSYFPELLKNQYLEKAIDTIELPDVILLSSSENFSLEKCQEWIDIILRWADACQSSGAKHSLFLPLSIDDPGKLKLPPPDIRLKYYVIAGIPSTLEVQLLCRHINNEINAESQWRGHILASLAGNDLHLCELLWDEVFHPIDNIIDVLRKYAYKIGWNNNFNNNLQKWRPKPPGIELSLYPTDANFNFLGSGKTIFTPEYGEEIHPGYLAMNNRNEDIIHRIWRAQAAMLLPMIDDVRRTICNYFSTKYGDNWAVIDNEIRISPIEMGPLKVFFDSLPLYSWEKRQWDVGIHLTWSIRNDLAHYTPISYQKYFDFLTFNNSIHSLIRQF